MAQDRGLWERRADFPLAASGVSTTTVYGHKLYAVCGASEKGPLNSLFIYDPALDRWSSAAPLPIEGGAEECNVGAAAGRLYVLGASRSAGPVLDGNTYMYDPLENQWQVVAKMPNPRTGSGVVVIGAKIYVLGGTGAEGKSLSTFDVFDTITHRWTRLPDMPTARDHLTARSINGLIYAISGRNGEAVVGANEEYNPSNRAWRARVPIPTPRYRLASGKNGTRIQVLGGVGQCAGTGNACAQNEEYDPSADTWRPLLPMASPRYGIAAATLDGRVFAVAGGTGERNQFSAVHEAFYLPMSARPAIHTGGIVNAASLSPGVSAGSLVSLFGERLSQGEQQSMLLPIQMNGVTVKLNGAPVPLVYVSFGQINFQIPLDFPLGPIELSVTNAGLESPKVVLPSLAQYSPAIFTLGESGDGQGAILIEGAGLVAGGRKTPGFQPAHPGDIIEIYCTGLGPVIARDEVSAATVGTPVVTIGGVLSDVISSRLAGSPGVYQVNVRIPVTAALGMAVPVSLRIGPQDVPASNEVTIAILE